MIVLKHIQNTPLYLLFGGHYTLKLADFVHFIDV